MRLTVLFASIFISNVKIVMLRSHYRGKICRIWDLLAAEAVNLGCTFFVLIGDDVRFKTAGWKGEIEGQFAEVSAARGLPFGVGVISFRDEAFDVFPTFPVMHKIHFEIFGTLFPIEFINQHGDPFLFEIYRRFGASEFAYTATLNNTIGGKTDARYSKHNFNWQSNILTNAVAKIVSYLEKIQASKGGKETYLFRCLSVVVPTFRCKMQMLQNITSLSSTSPDVSINILVVVDNPALAESTMSEIKGLEDYTANHLVRVYVNSENLGASLSRNTGIASVFGDWIVLLDDDVIPDKDILDAYLGAILRFPQAQILVGLTELPIPVTYMEQALVASQM